jgi:hypothetical protein
MSLARLQAAPVDADASRQLLLSETSNLAVMIRLIDVPKLMPYEDSLCTKAAANHERATSLGAYEYHSWFGI